jgi:hypothetical protein
MKPIDPTPLITHLKQRLAKAQAELLDVETTLHLVETEGIPHPKDIWLRFNNSHTGDMQLCIYCCGWEDLDNDFHMFTDQNHRNIMCTKCYRKYAPYLTRLLVPYIQKNEEFFDIMCRTHRDNIYPLTESRVPVIMDFLSRSKRLKAFI